MEAANLPTFLEFGNANKSHICAIFAKKIMGGHESGRGGLEQNWGRPPGPGLKPPLLICRSINHQVPMTHGECNASGYLPNHRASQPFDWYQIIGLGVLHGEQRHMCVNNLPRVVTWLCTGQWVRVKPVTLRSPIQHATITPPTQVYTAAVQQLTHVSQSNQNSKSDVNLYSHR